MAENFQDLTQPFKKNPAIIDIHYCRGTAFLAHAQQNIVLTGSSAKIHFMSVMIGFRGRDNGKEFGYVKTLQQVAAKCLFVFQLFGISLVPEIAAAAGREIKTLRMPSPGTSIAGYHFLKIKKTATMIRAKPTR